MIVDPSGIEIQTKIESKEYRNLSRRIMSRESSSAIQLQQTIKPGKVTDGCLVCCYSPSFCPLCSILPVSN